MDQAIEAAAKAIWEFGPKLDDHHHPANMRKAKAALQAAAPILKAEHERELLLALRKQPLAGFSAGQTNAIIAFLNQFSAQRGFARSRNIDLGEGE